MAYLKIQNVARVFTSPGGRTVRALDDVSFELERGQILSIVGQNGSGKTTLLNCIRGALPCDHGSIEIGNHQSNGTCVNGRPTIVSVFQDVNAGVVPSMTAIENLALVAARTSSRNWWTFPQRRYADQIHGFLAETELLERFQYYEHAIVSELSGGQRQQLAIIMAMMREPDVLLLDEFVGSLDPRMRDDILDWTRRWIRSRSVTTLMVTHDHALAEQWGDIVLELTDGKVTRFSPSAGQVDRTER